MQLRRSGTSFAVVPSSQIAGKSAGQIACPRTAMRRYDPIAQQPIGFFLINRAKGEGVAYPHRTARDNSYVFSAVLNIGKDDLSRSLDLRKTNGHNSQEDR